MSNGVVRSAVPNESSPPETSFSLDALSAPWRDYTPMSLPKKSLVRLSPPSLNPYVEVKDSDILAIEYLQLHIGIGKRYLERGINWWLFTQGESGKGRPDTYVECTEDPWNHLHHLHHANILPNTGEIALGELEHGSVHLFHILAIA